jgi:hypothetical protein
VACYISNTTIYEELLMWGIVLEVSDTLKDVLVLDNLGNTNWFPSRRWRSLDSGEVTGPFILGTLA